MQLFTGFFTILSKTLQNIAHISIPAQQKRPQADAAVECASCRRPSLGEKSIGITGIVLRVHPGRSYLCQIRPILR